VSFRRLASLEEMVGHIYGRNDLVVSPDRPHVLIRELQLHLAYLKEELEGLAARRSQRSQKELAELAEHLVEAIAHYRAVERDVVGRPRETWARDLDALESELRRIARAEASAEAARTLAASTLAATRQRRGAEPLGTLL
jgi:uncharacterized protein YukE